jgi:chromosome segregation protein
MLSALELNGFKSFADRTRLEFPRGITVVVGPNGSGKSNVVDAIKWDLGAQSVKSLRGKEMTDVIFSGSRDRRPAGTAEASLVFDNADRMLDFDAPEVQITRRVYRSGESEYLINRQPCRLRDIRDLLAGFGSGNGAYNIIEQGKVDAVLQSTPKDRRLIFEEAAGISRFRLKREEALRRLERVQQNLLRLSDIVDEVDSRLKTVRTQAAKAQRYQDVAQRLKQLRIELALQDWRELSAHIARLAERAAADEQHVASAESELADAAACVARHEQQAADLERALVDAVTAETAVRERLAQCDSTRASHTARVDELEQEAQRLAHQLAALASRAGDTQQLVGDTQSELDKSQAHRALLEQRLAAKRTELAQREAEHAAVRQVLAAAQSALDEAQREALDAIGKAQLLEARLHAVDDSLAQLDEEAATLAEGRQRLADDAKRAQSALEHAAADYQQAADRLNASQRALAFDRSRLTAVHKRQADLGGRLTGARQRTEVLEELERRLEGLTSGAKEVIRQARDNPHGPYQSLRGVVADLLHVDADMAPLVETALGERASFLVLAETKELAAELVTGTAAWPGRTSFLRLDVPAPASAVDRIDLAGEPGVMGRADQFVETEADLATLARRLLGRFWLVDKLATALQLASGIGRGLNFVTAACEAVLADGTLTVGPRQSLAGLLSRRSELRALREQILEMEAELATASQDAQRLEHDLSQAEAAAHQLSARHETAAKAHADIRLQSASLADRLAQAESRLAAISRSRDNFAAQAQALSLDRQANESLAAACRQSVDRLRQEIAQCQAQSSALEGQLGVLHRSSGDDRVELARSEQRLEGLRAQMDQLRRDHAERDRALDETRTRLQQCADQKKRLQESIGELTAESELLQRQREALAAQAAQSQAIRETSQNDRAAAFAAAERARAAMLESQVRLQKSRLELQQVEQRRTALADRFREDYQFDLAAGAREAASLDASSAAPPLRRDAIEAEICDLRDRLQAAGPVNLESLAELEALEGRYGSLAGQVADLEAARARLEQIIQQINGESRQLFVATLDLVRQHFQDIFRRLFNGGEADIVVEQDESGDILESGVAIIARPPGKQPRAITLLSGGERTLTCVALLLAIFRSRPSPFCVLDEVDAALDEANIDRFVGVLKEFMQTTQFIVITHSKRTMTCADTLHGVTMQQSGVSKRVSVRFEDVAEDGRIRPAALKAA